MEYPKAIIVYLLLLWFTQAINNVQHMHKFILIPFPGIFL